MGIIYWPFGENYCFFNGMFFFFVVALVAAIGGMFFRLGFGLLK